VAAAAAEMTSNPFDLLDDVDSDDHAQLLAAAEKKAAAKPAPAAPAAAKPAAKLPTKPPPPGQAGKLRFPLGVSPCAVKTRLSDCWTDL
jgi:hypothetical protein